MARGCPKCGSLEATVGATLGTLLAPMPPTRDAQGVVHYPPDPNTYTTEYTCLKCGTHYKESRRAGEDVAW
jgi:hypothetical protein